jgi:hypothetical protein
MVDYFVVSFVFLLEIIFLVTLLFNLAKTCIILLLTEKKHAHGFFSIPFVDKMYSAIFRQVRNKLLHTNTLRTCLISVYKISLFTIEEKGVFFFVLIL